MLKPKTVESEVLAAMHALDDVQRAHANPFLYTRISSKLAEKRNNSWDQLFSIISKPAFALGMIITIIALDGFFIFNSGESPAPVSEYSISAQYLESYDRDLELSVVAFEDERTIQQP